MELHKVPGLSVAVIDNFEITWAKGYGVTEAGSTNPVTPQTLFQAGSVSKPVAGAGALSLVGQGKLSLDENVNEKLTTWNVPDNEFTKEQKVTLRRILSHSAGLTVHGFPGYAVDETVPALVQVLNGEKPANTEPVRVDFVPGTKWSYSGGGTLIAQQLMIDVTGKPFPQLMREIVFDKIGMYDSSFEQPLPLERQKMAASGTYWNGKVVPGKWHVYPEMAAAGLWSTPSDLARFAIEIALSKKDKSNRVLSQPMAREMLNVQMETLTEFTFGDKQNPDRMGLGFFLGDETRPDLFGHIGDDEGFQAMLMMYSDSGQGVAIMTNSEFGILLGDCIVENIAQEYSWKNYTPPDRPQIGASAALLAFAHLEGIQTALKQYQILKQEYPSRYTLDESTLSIFAYLLLADSRLQDALEVMKLAVQEYPEYWNAYDTLAEVYMILGERQLAIQNYEKAVELNPENRSAIENLKTLKGKS
jgi:CubicO group peptidase (beta-lactamase class C family)